MDSRNISFVCTEKGFGTSDQCDVGLGLRMQQVEESCPNKSFMPFHFPHHHLSSSTSSCCDGGACGVGPIVCNTGDIYDVVGAVLFKSLHHQHGGRSFPHNNCSEEEMAAAPVNTRVPFTASQWQELERQTMIFKFMMASLPVPSELLIPFTTNPSNVVKGSLELGFSSNSSDPEPWRCRRTDGKKWRCSRDVAPDQKYCERHSHKSRPRSRKPVELPNHSIYMASDHSRSSKQPHQNPNFINHNDTSSFDHQPRCLEWFMKGETTASFAGNCNPEWQQFKAQGTKYASEHQQHYKDYSQHFSPTTLASLEGSLNLNPKRLQETRSFIDAWSAAYQREVAEMDGIGSKRTDSSLSMSGGNIGNNNQDDENSHQMDPISWMGSAPGPGGPLAEALCLGIACSQSTSTNSCSKST